MGEKIMKIHRVIVGSALSVGASRKGDPTS